MKQICDSIYCTIKVMDHTDKIYDRHIVKIKTPVDFHLCRLPQPFLLAQPALLILARSTDRPFLVLFNLFATVVESSDNVIQVSLSFAVDVFLLFFLHL